MTMSVVDSMPVLLVAFGRVFDLSTGVRKLQLGNKATVEIEAYFDPGIGMMVSTVSFESLDFQIDKTILKNIDWPGTDQPGRKFKGPDPGAVLDCCPPVSLSQHQMLVDLGYRMRHAQWTHLVRFPSQHILVNWV